MQSFLFLCPLIKRPILLRGTLFKWCQVQCSIFQTGFCFKGIKHLKFLCRELVSSHTIVFLCSGKNKDQCFTQAVLVVNESALIINLVYNSKVKIITDKSKTEIHFMLSPSFVKSSSSFTRKVRDGLWPWTIYFSEQLRNVIFIFSSINKARLFERCRVPMMCM